MIKDIGTEGLRASADYDQYKCDADDYIEDETSIIFPELLMRSITKSTFDMLKRTQSTGPR